MQKDTNPSAVISPHLSVHLIGQCAKELAEDVKFPLETSNFAALIAASHAVGSVYSVCYPDGSPLPVPLYGIAEQPSGTGKSRIVNELYRGYIDRGAILNKEIRQKREATRKSIASKEKSGMDVPEYEASELERLIDIPSGTTDATPQSLEKVMARYNGFFMVYGTEQNLTKTLLGGLYAEGAVVDGIINSAFNGEHSSTERASNERVTFHGRPYGGIFCLSQSGTIQTVLDSAGSSGLAERFLMIREDDLLGHRNKHPDITDDELKLIIAGVSKPPKSMLERCVKTNPRTAYKQYRAKMEQLALERSQLESHDIAGLNKLKFTPDAWALIESVQEMFERNIAKQTVRNSFIASMNSKIDILVMKVAASIHVTDCDTATHGRVADEISIDTVRSAYFTVNELFLGVQKIADSNSLYGNESEDEHVIEYMQEQRKPRTMDELVRNIKRQKNTPFKFYTGRGAMVAKIRECIERLVENGKVVEDRRSNPFRYSA